MNLIWCVCVWGGGGLLDRISALKLVMVTAPALRNLNVSAPDMKRRKNV